MWLDPARAVFVAVEDDRVLGTYYLRKNRSGPAGHVCNCGYIVAEGARGRGIASAMCEHSQQEAIARGYRGMQYNLVVSTNKRAIRLWRKHGFEIVGTVPGAYDHARDGFVDAHVMFKALV